jgi:hypothetical protein
MDLHWGRTQILNIGRIRRINRHPVKRDKDSTPESIWDTEDQLTWKGDIDNPNDSEEDYAADVKSDIAQNNTIEDPQCPVQRNVSPVPNVPGSIQPTHKSKWQAEIMLGMVNAIKTRRNKEVKKM